MTALADDWFAAAACRGATAVMFPERGRSSKRARAVCASCPVRAECFEYACNLVVCPDFGVWAGLTNRELLAARAERHRVAGHPRYQKPGAA
jgi:WhiB family redox-sensing transcriptional regulator